MNAGLHKAQVSDFILLSGWLVGWMVELADTAHRINWQMRSEVWLQMKNNITILCWQFWPLILHMVTNGYGAMVEQVQRGMSEPHQHIFTMQDSQ